jgi:hypothetical protein
VHAFDEGVRGEGELACAAAKDGGVVAGPDHDSVGCPARCALLRTGAVAKPVAKACEKGVLAHVPQ